MICCDVSDLDMEQIKIIVGYFGQKLHRVMTEQLKDFESSHHWEDSRKENARYSKMVDDITFGFYQGCLVRHVRGGDVMDLFAIMMLSEAVGFSPHTH